MDRHEALELLETNHTFPGPYRVRAVVRTGGAAAVVSAVAALVGDGVQRVEEQPSRKGTYVSVRMDLHVDSAEQVLEVYDILDALDIVLTTM